MIFKSIRMTGLTLVIFSATVMAAFEYADYLSALCTRESGCNPTSINQFGFIGSYQMGEAALIDSGYYQRDGSNANDWRGRWTGKNGINSLADFQASSAKQTQAINDYNAKQWTYIQADGSDNFIGQTINGVLITESGLLAGAHLVGHAGLKTYLQSGGTVVPKDANKVAVSNYIAKFSGYDISAVSGRSTTLTGGVGNVGAGTPATYGTGSASYQNPFLGAGSVTGPLPNPATSFQSGTGGVSYSDVTSAVQALISSIVLLWLAYVAWGQLIAWGEGTISVMVMQANIIKASVMTMFLLFIVLA